jgi:hypothetical protein
METLDWLLRVQIACNVAREGRKRPDDFRHGKVGLIPVLLQGHFSLSNFWSCQ